MVSVMNAHRHLDLYRSGLPLSVQNTVKVYWEDPDTWLPGQIRARALLRDQSSRVIYESPPRQLGHPFSDHPSMLVTFCVPSAEEDPFVLQRYASGLLAILAQSIHMSPLGFWYVGEPALSVRAESNKCVVLSIAIATKENEPTLTWRHRNTDIVVVMKESHVWWVCLAWTLAGPWDNHWERADRLHQLIEKAVSRL